MLRTLAALGTSALLLAFAAAEALAASPWVDMPWR